jgi:hypothetical protein
MLSSPLQIRAKIGRPSQLEKEEEEKKFDIEEALPRKHLLIEGIYSNLNEFLGLHSRSLDFEEMNLAESF